MEDRPEPGGMDMMEKVKNSKIGILLLLTGAVYFFLRYLSPLVAPALVAMLFVTMFGSTLKKLQGKLHIHRQVGAIVLLLLAGVIFAVLLWTLFSWVVGSLPGIIGKLEVWEEDITQIVQNVCGSIGGTIGVDSEYLEETILQGVYEAVDYVQLKVVPGVLSYSWQYAKGLVTVGGFLVTFIIATILLAKDYDKIMNNLLDREECHVLLEVICGIIRYIATFVKAQLIIMSIIAGFCALTLGIAGIRHGVLWGIVTGLLDVFPFVGTGIVLIPMALTQMFYGYYGKAAVCVILYVVCIFAREFLEPRLIGKKVGVPAIAVLVSLYAGIRLFGIWGIIKGPLGFIIIYETYQSLQKRK
ncbi:MAG: AI-2E family transporter [Lachnospiraceae bacterium]|nr:AI-2E family transporter [Lachnospiraceae bacterium]